MYRQIIITIAIFCSIFFVPYAFGDVSADFEQSKALIQDYISSGKIAEAEAAYQKLLKDFAGSRSLSSAVYDIAETYRNCSKFDKSLQVYQDVVTRWPASSEAVWAQRGIAASNIALGKMAEAQVELIKLKTSYSSDPNIAEAVFHVADTYYWFGKYNEANSVYIYVISNYPHSDFAMWAQMGLAISAIAQDKDSVAAAAKDSLVATFGSNPKLPEALTYIAARYEYSKKYGKAKAIYEQIGTQFPQSPQAVDVPFALDRMKVYGLIESSSPQALRAIDDLANKFRSRADLLWCLSSPIAERLFEKAFQMEEEVMGQQRHDYFQKAVEIWEMVTEKSPSLTCNADGYTWAGHCYRELGKYSKAIECYKEVVEKYPEHSLASNDLFLIGRCYEAMKEAGAISGSEADTKIKSAYEQLIAKYPECASIQIAREWLKENADGDSDSDN